VVEVLFPNHVDWRTRFEEQVCLTRWMDIVHILSSMVPERVIGVYLGLVVELQKLVSWKVRRDSDSRRCFLEEVTEGISAPFATLVLVLSAAEAATKTRLSCFQGIVSTAFRKASFVIVAACKHGKQHAALTI